MVIVNVQVMKRRMSRQAIIIITAAAAAVYGIIPVRVDS